MDVSAIVSEYGAYYLNSGQNAQRLFKAMYAGNDLDQHFTVRETNDSVFQLASASMDRLIQPFQKQWTPTGEVTFEPSPIQTFRLKVDFEDYPDELEESWLAFLASGNLDRKNWPFIKWLMEEHIAPKANEDVLLNEAFDGEYAAPTPGTAGAAGTAMNGIKTIRNAHITASEISPLTIGALETVATDFVTQMEQDFVRAIEPKFRKLPMVMIMSVENYELFRQGQLEKYNMYYEQANLDTFRLFPNIKVIGSLAWGTSDIITCTPMSNQFCVWKHGKNVGKFGIESVDRKVKLWNDYRKGYGYAIPRLVFTNDLELPA